MRVNAWHPLTVSTKWCQLVPKSTTQCKSVMILRLAGGEWFRTRQLMQGQFLPLLPLPCFVEELAPSNTLAPGKWRGRDTNQHVLLWWPSCSAKSCGFCPSASLVIPGLPHPLFVSVCAEGTLEWGVQVHELMFTGEVGFGVSPKGSVFLATCCFCWGHWKKNSWPSSVE